MSEVPEIDVDEVARRQAAGDLLLDVRNPDEFDEVHAAGAQLLPLPELADRFEEVPDGPLLVICRSGARSAAACEFLRARGIDAVNVRGGTLAWVEAGLPVASRGAPG